MIGEFPAPGEQPMGGPQVAVKRLVPKLVQRGIDVVVVAPDSRHSTEAVMKIDDGATLITVPAGARWTLARGLQPWRRRAGAVVERIGADVVHAQGLLAGLIAVDVKER